MKRNKALLAFFLVALFLTSCRTSQTTTAERNTAHTESTLREIHTTDSVFIHDSIFIREGGDTVVRERWRTCWRDRIVHDTVRERVTDTIHETNTIEKVVQVSKKGSFTGWLVAIVLFLIIVVYILIKTLLKR